MSILTARLGVVARYPLDWSRRVLVFRTLSQQDPRNHKKTLVHLGGSGTRLVSGLPSG